MGAVGHGSNMTHEQKEEILQLCEAGNLTYARIGEMYGISGARVGQMYNQKKQLGTKDIKEIIRERKEKLIREKREKKEKIKTRKQECLKCHKTFQTELDKMGIPYNKMCPKCHEANRYLGEAIGRGVHKSSSRGYREE